MFMNACNIYITYFHHYHSMSSIIYTHFIIIIINTKHVHIYMYHIIQYNQSSVNHRITSQGLHSTKQYTNRHTNRKLHIIEPSRKITKTEICTHSVHTRIMVPIRTHTRITMSHTRIIRISPDSKWPRNQLICVSALPYAYHQNNFPLSKLSYVYEHPHTLSYAKHQYVVLGTGQLRIIRVQPLGSVPHTRISLIPYAYGTVSYAKHQKMPSNLQNS